MNTLEARLRAVMEEFPAKTALLAVDLTENRPLAAIDADTQVVSASTIKVMILCCALQQVMDGKLSLQQFVPIGNADYCDDTAVYETEYRRDGATLWEHLYWMIVSSDNTATNTIISLLGYDAVNTYCAELGLSATSLQRKMLDFDAIAAGRNNYTSPADQGKIYSLLYRGEILNPELRAVAMDFLCRNRDFDGLLRYIPDNVPVARKGGTLDYLHHRAGIFLTERPYFLGIYTWDGPSAENDPEQLRLIGKLSRMVYDTMKRGGLL